MNPKYLQFLIRVNDVGWVLFKPVCKFLLNVTGKSNFALSKLFFYLALLLLITPGWVEVFTHPDPVNTLITTLVTVYWLWRLPAWYNRCHNELVRTFGDRDSITTVEIPYRTVMIILSILKVRSWLLLLSLAGISGDLLWWGFDAGDTAWLSALISLYLLTFHSPRKRSAFGRAWDKAKTVRITLPRLVPSPVPAS